ncbi:hypothetical protein B0O99DRAFT_736397 [Bisporella sp. PMI_857]|nr:hypothetical protein B0O99DRAFT_736397 [Bisporella sp. PMI_857]
MAQPYNMPPDSLDENIFTQFVSPDRGPDDDGYAHPPSHQLEFDGDDLLENQSGNNAPSIIPQHWNVGKDSVQSRVAETPFQSFASDTEMPNTLVEGHDTLHSMVEETQFIELEREAENTDHSQGAVELSPNSQRLIESARPPSVVKAKVAPRRREQNARWFTSLLGKSNSLANEPLVSLPKDVVTIKERLNSNLPAPSTPLDKTLHAELLEANNSCEQDVCVSETTRKELTKPAQFTIAHQEVPPISQRVASEPMAKASTLSPRHNISPRIKEDMPNLSGVRQQKNNADVQEQQTYISCCQQTKNAPTQQLPHLTPNNIRPLDIGNPIPSHRQPALVPDKNLPVPNQNTHSAGTAPFQYNKQNYRCHSHIASRPIAGVAHVGISRKLSGGYRKNGLTKPFPDMFPNSRSSCQSHGRTSDLSSRNTSNLDRGCMTFKGPMHNETTKLGKNEKPNSRSTDVSHVQETTTVDGNSLVQHNLYGETAKQEREALVIKEPLRYSGSANQVSSMHYEKDGQRSQEQLQDGISPVLEPVPISQAPLTQRAIENGELQCEKYSHSRDGVEEETTVVSQCPKNIHSIQIAQCDLSIPPDSYLVASSSRPPSRRGNHGKPAHFENSTKIKKSKTNHRVHDRSGPFVDPLLRYHEAPSIATAYRNFLQAGQTFQAQIAAYEQQTQLIEQQKEQIEILQLSSTESLAKIEALEEDKRSLKLKITKYQDMHAKYRNHISEVRNYQEQLKQEAAEIRKETNSLKEEAMNEADRQCKLSSEFTAKLKIEIRSIKDKSLQVNKELEAEIKNLKSRNLILQEDINARLRELSRERHNTEQLQERMSAQTATYKELDEAIRSVPTHTAEVLKRDGFLDIFKEIMTLIRSLEKSDQDTFPELVKIVKDSCARIEEKLPAFNSNYTAQQDFYSREFEELKNRITQIGFDHELHDHLNIRIMELRESNATLTATLVAKQSESQGMTSRINQLEHDVANYRDQLIAKSDELTAFMAIPKEDVVLQSKIKDLENLNVRLQNQANNADQESLHVRDEVRSLQKSLSLSQDHIRELEEKVMNAQSSLNYAAEEKKQYLANAITDIQNAKYETAKEFAEKLKEEHAQHEALRGNLDQALVDAETKLKGVKEQLRSTEEDGIKSTNEINQLHTDISSFKETINEQAAHIEQLCQRPTRQEFENAIFAYMEQLNQQGAEIKHLEEQIPTQEELNARERELQSARSDIAKLQNDIEAFRNADVQKLDSIVQNHKDIEERLQRLDALEIENQALINQKDALERENSTLEGENQLLQSKNEGLVKYINEPGLHGHKALLDDSASAIPIKTPTKIASSVINKGPGDATRSVEWTKMDGGAPDTQATLTLTTIDTNPVHPTPEEVLQTMLDHPHTTVGTLQWNSQPAIQSVGSAATPSLTSLPFPQIVAGLTPGAAWRSSEAGSQSSTASAQRSLKPANRRRSNLATQFLASGQTNVSRSSRVTTSTVSRTTHHTHETVLAVEPLKENSKSPTRQSHGGIDSSPLSELDPDLLKNLEAQKNYKQRGSGCLSMTNAELDNMPKKTRVSLSRYVATPHHTEIYSDKADEAGFNNTYNLRKSGVPSQKKDATVEQAITTHHKNSQPKQLKSAMKKTNYVTLSNTETQDTTAIDQGRPSISSRNHVFQEMSAGRGVNKTIAQSTSSAGMHSVAGIKGAVAGTNLASRNSGRRRSSLQPSADQSTFEELQKSPLMPAPKRNEKKRKAPDELRNRSLSSSSLKSLRTSYTSASLRTIIPNSEEKS